jgi:hypothetical protein
MVSCGPSVQGVRTAHAAGQLIDTKDQANVVAVAVTELASRLNKRVCLRLLREVGLK